MSIVWHGGETPPSALDVDTVLKGIEKKTLRLTKWQRRRWVAWLMIRGFLLGCLIATLYITVVYLLVKGFS